MDQSDVTEVWTFRLGDLAVRTGDLICTTDGGAGLAAGQFWRLVGHLIPGEVDHVVIYVGPGGRCVEAGARGRVIAFEVPDAGWEAEAMFAPRGLLDQLYGVADPVGGRGLPPEREPAIRIAAAKYALAQARAGKPYNLNFLDSRTEDAFYCSQLAYLAYLHQGIDLNTGTALLALPCSRDIVFPQEVWEACRVKRRASLPIQGGRP